MTTAAPMSVPLSAHRAVVVGSLATCAAYGLWNAPGIMAPPAHPVDILDWWALTGTPASAMAIVRLLGLALAAVAAASAGAALLAASTGSVRVARACRRLVPNSMQRLLAHSIVIGLAANPAIATAEELPAPPPILTDLGAVDPQRSAVDPAPVLIDLGPVEADPATTKPVTELNSPEEWTVEAGDHLWRVAHETLVDRGADPTAGEIERYWRRLIDDNRAVIGADPDLIHPGIVLTLPA